VDRSVGAILRTLDELGLTENTIVLYTSDHGDMMGSHHMVEKSVMYEEAVRIPWLMRIPQLNGKRCSITHPVSHIDMIPTLLDLLDVENNRSFPGRSLVPLIQGNLDAQRDVHIEWNPNSGALKVKKGGTQLASKTEQNRIQNEHSRAIVTCDGWKLCLSDADKSQLFNLREDPGETVNLFDSGRHKDIILKLTKKIHRWQDQVKDTVKV
jgi:arylsulfatase A-like enzyme